MSSVDIVPVAESKQLEESSVSSKTPEKPTSPRASDEVKDSTDVETTGVRAPMKNPWSKINSQSGQGNNGVSYQLLHFGFCIFEELSLNHPCKLLEFELRYQNDDKNRYFCR